MVASATQSHSQPPSAEEEALKRNTDCVYFLASPLTCKKGSECEYRHSDIARVNPRDCWFWLHGNCLNPKCGFRHPPLDGLQGAQTPTSTGPSAPIPQNVIAPTSHVPNASTKQGGVACIFFQRGYCLKGDWCPFLHVPNSLNNKASSVPVAASTVEPAATNTKAFTGFNNSMQEKKALPMNKEKAVKDPPRLKPANVVEHALFRNELSLNGRASGITEFPRYKNASPASNGNPISWSSRVQQPHILDEPESTNNKDAEEVSREPSPGFDVLVDDDRRDSDYYTGEDRYGMSMEHEGRNEYNIDHSTDYGMIAALDDERYKGSLGYDSHEHHNGRHAWEQHRTSSERMSGRSYLEKRPYDRLDSVGQVDGSDLRYRLAKNRKSNGLRSVIRHENDEDSKAGDWGYHNSCRDEHRVSLQENSLSSRLRGRIRLSGRFSPPVDDTMSRGAGRGRASIPSHQGRIRGKGGLEEAFNNGGGDYRGHLRREKSDENTNFAGPKSLAELKNRKNSEPVEQNEMDQHSIGKRKHRMLDFHPQSGSDLSFEGPKPLEEILKRKRGEIIGSINSRNTSENQGVEEDENQERKDSTMNEVHQSTSVQKIDAEDTRLAASNPLISSKPEAETGVLQESEAQNEGGGEFDYGDQVGGEEFDTYDGENVDGTGEYLDEEEDDDDEFAKKMGVVYS